MRKIFGMQELFTICWLLLLVVTGLGLVMMPSSVGADWPGWTSLIVLVALTCLPAAWLLLLVSAGAATVARWIALAAVGAVLLRLIWSVYDAGPAVVIAVLPVLLLVVLIAVALVYSRPRALSRELKELAERNGWQVVDSRGLQLPTLPLPVGRAWTARDAVQTPTGVAFEVQWLQWHGVLARRRRLSVFVTTLDAALPTLEVRPGGLTRSDIVLESAEFNRSFDVLGENPRYLMSVLHPRTMQALLDTRPIGLALSGTALVLYDDAPLTVKSLTRGLSGLDRIKVPRHVLEDWGSYPGQPAPGLRFVDPGFEVSYGGALLRMTGLAATLLGLTYVSCLAAVSL
ncbi:hypothetical protein ACFTSF_24960 [Kribbella sp. NPDC056951]|uniref:hypothetical protein n=1 Tax=Kribbella sp. NPDC056951 TaxID=3345978 RepID=UPI0036454D03